MSRYAPKTLAITASYSENAQGVFDAYTISGSSITLTLGSPATRGVRYISNIGNASATIATSGTSTTIDGSATLTLLAGAAVTLVADGVGSLGNWNLMGSDAGESSGTGTITVGAIAGGDSSLGIDGQAAAQGGAIVVTGGASSTGGNTGGAVSVIGGTGNTSGLGGPVNITGGTAGSTGAGGQINITGGVPIAAAGGAVVIAGGAGVGTNKAGGLASVTGGAAAGAAIGGVASLVGGAGGAGGATGKGGAALVTGGATTATNADGGAAVIAGGAKNGGGFIGPVVLGNAQLMPVWYPQAAPASDAGDTSPTVTVAQMVAGIVSGTPTQARTFTLPTGTEMDAGVAFADVPATFGFDFSVQNRAAFAATDDIITVAAGASGMTVTGSATVAPGVTGRFRAVRTAATTWIIYKIAG